MAVVAALSMTSADDPAPTPHDDTATTGEIPIVYGPKVPEIVGPDPDVLLDQARQRAAIQQMFDAQRASEAAAAKATADAEAAKAKQVAAAQAKATAAARTEASAPTTRSTSTPATSTVAPAPTAATGNALKDYALAKVGPTEFSCLDKLWTRESGWNPAAHNPSSTAYGIPQLLDSTWAVTGIAKSSNGYTQIDAGLAYIRLTYGTACNAWAHSQSTGWY